MLEQRTHKYPVLPGVGQVYAGAPLICAVGAGAKLGPGAGTAPSQREIKKDDFKETKLRGAAAFQM